MPTYLLNTPRLSELTQTNEWTIYDHVRRGDFPLEPLRIGRKIMWRTADVERLLGLEAGSLSGGES